MSPRKNSKFNDEKNGTLESVLLGHDAGNRRARFLASVLVIRSNEKDVFALAWAGVAFVYDMIGCSRLRAK